MDDVIAELQVCADDDADQLDKAHEAEYHAGDS
jgi:hypothetical protein